MTSTRALVIPLFCASLAAPAADVTFTGRARDLETGALLYLESHAVSDSGGPRESRVVSYLCANGALFARKSLDFGGARLAPAFALDDARSGLSEGLERRPQGVTVFAQARGAALR